MLIVIQIRTCDVNFDWPLIFDRLLSILVRQVSPFASQRLWKGIELGSILRAAFCTHPLPYHIRQILELSCVEVEILGSSRKSQSKHLEYTAYFWKGNINNLAHFSWVITLSPPDLCFYPTGGLYKPCFCSNPWCIQV